MTFDSVKDWIDSFQDRDGRARAMLEACAVDENAPDMVRLAAHAATGDSYHSQVVAALLKPAKKRRGRNKAERRLQRMHNHHPALAGLGWKPVKEGPVEKQYGGSLGPQTRLDPQLQKPKSEAELAFDASFATFVYENQKKMWLHLPDLKFDPPPGYKPRGPMVNPFWPKPDVPSKVVKLVKSDLLMPDVCKVYDAMAYAMLHHGVVMNMHVTIIWSMLGLSEEEGSEILGKYLHGAQKWLRVGCKPRKRRVANARTGTELRFVWVHENAPGRGFHSHVLCHLPVALKRGFDAWSRAYLVKLIGKHFPWKAFRLVRSYAKTENGEVRRAWAWFRYISKQVPSNENYCWRGSSGEIFECPARDILKPWPYRESLSVPYMKLAGVSHNIGKKRQTEDGFVSPLSRCEFDRLYCPDALNMRRQQLAFDRRTAELIKALAV